MNGSSYLRGHANINASNYMRNHAHRSLDETQNDSNTLEGRSLVILLSVLVTIVFLFLFYCFYNLIQVLIYKITNRNVDPEDTVLVHEGRVFNLAGDQRRAVLEAIFSETSKAVTDQEISKRKRKKKKRRGITKEETDANDLTDLSDEVPCDVEIPHVSTFGTDDNKSINGEIPTANVENSNMNTNNISNQAKRRGSNYSLCYLGRTPTQSREYNPSFDLDDDYSEHDLKEPVLDDSYLEDPDEHFGTDTNFIYTTPQPSTDDNYYSYNIYGNLSFNTDPQKQGENISEESDTVRQELSYLNGSLDEGIKGEQKQPPLNRTILQSYESDLQDLYGSRSYPADGNISRRRNSTGGITSTTRFGTMPGKWLVSLEAARLMSPESKIQRRGSTGLINTEERRRDSMGSIPSCRLSIPGKRRSSMGNALFSRRGSLGKITANSTLTSQCGSMSGTPARRHSSSTGQLHEGVTPKREHDLDATDNLALLSTPEPNSAPFFDFDEKTPKASGVPFMPTREECHGKISEETATSRVQYTYPITKTVTFPLDDDAYDIPSFEEDDEVHELPSLVLPDFLARIQKEEGFSIEEEIEFVEENEDTEKTVGAGNHASGSPQTAKSTRVTPYSRKTDLNSEETKEEIAAVTPRQDDFANSFDDSELIEISSRGSSSAGGSRSSSAAVTRLMNPIPLQRFDSFTTATSEYTYDDDSTTGDNICPICLCGYRKGNILIVSKHCTHMYHKECILEWLEKHDDCPICRVGMVTDSELSKAATSIVGKTRMYRASSLRSPPRSPTRRPAATGLGGRSSWLAGGNMYERFEFQP